MLVLIVASILGYILGKLVGHYTAKILKEKIAEQTEEFIIIFVENWTPQIRPITKEIHEI